MCAGAQVENRKGLGFDNDRPTKLGKDFAGRERGAGGRERERERWTGDGQREGGRGEGGRE